MVLQRLFILLYGALLAALLGPVVVRSASATANASLAPVYSSLDSDDHATTGGLVWSDLCVVSDQGTVLLDDCSGSVANGQICAIMGPSGAGKSSFLAALGGHQSLSVHGQVYAYHHTRDKLDSATLILERIPVSQVAWLQQNDDFFCQLTVEETLRFAAFLELPHLPLAHRERLVASHIDSLGLTHAANRQISSHLGHGSRLSGGERRRLSVALELLTEKQLVLADEPTSGLDSSMSEKVMKLLKDMAIERNIPCLCSLHQPRSSIWHSLDSFILMATGGKVCYAGDCHAAVDYFSKLGYECPKATNPAEFFVDLVSVDTEDPMAAAEDRARIERLAQAFRKHQEKQWKRHKRVRETPKVIESKGSSVRQRRRRVGPLDSIPRFGALLLRSWRQNIRNHAVNLFRLTSSVLNAVLLAEIFPTVRGPVPTLNSVADRVALLSFGAITLCMMAYMKTANLFGKEMPVVQREQTRHQYTALEYLAAKVIAELPLDACFAAVFATVLKSMTSLAIPWTMLTQILSLLTVAGASLGFVVGSWAPNEQMATVAGIPLLVVLMVVGVINPSGVDLSHPPPRIVQVMKRMSPFSFAIEALCLGEYPGMKFATGNQGWFKRFADLPRMGGLALVRNGDQVIEALGLAGKSYTVTMEHLALLSLGNLMLGWMGLLFQQIPKRIRKTSRSDGADVPEMDDQKNYRRTTVSTTAATTTNEPLRVPGKLRF